MGKKISAVYKGLDGKLDEFIYVFLILYGNQKSDLYTNAIEAMHRQIRKITKTKGAFTSDQSLLKLVYLSYRDYQKKKDDANVELGLIMSQLYIKSGERLKAFGDFFLGGG